MKIVKKYAGGINFLAQAAIRADGALFMRVQERGPYGYKWSPWRLKRTIDPLNPPNTVAAGFANLYPVNRYNDFGCRLP